jgi:predicted GIY-YIG superfamily endonuclease
MWCVYIIEKRGDFYTGITTNLENRLRQHGNTPLLYKETFQNKHQAARRERQIKGYSRAKKQDLIKGLIR